MLFVASFPHSGETLRGDEVRETESRDGREREPEKESNRESNCTSLRSHSVEIPLHGPKTLIQYICCIITCVKSLNELTTRLSVESTRGTTDGL